MKKYSETTHTAANVILKICNAAKHTVTDQREKLGRMLS